MARGLWERLRAARGVELLAALAALALLALLLSRSGDQPAADRTALEARLERILSLVDGAGDVRAMVTEDGEGRVSGAVIVSSGNGGISTRLDLQSAVTTLLQIDAARVEIIFSGGSG